MGFDQSTPTDSRADPDTLDNAFLALRNRSRRFVCYFLLEHETASVSEVADAVSGWIYATNGTVVEPQCRARLQQELLHTHLPKLVDIGVIDYDETAGELSLSPCPEPVREIATRACAAETGS